MNAIVGKLTSRKFISAVLGCVLGAMIVSGRIGPTEAEIARQVAASIDVEIAKPAEAPAELLKEIGDVATIRIISGCALILGSVLGYTASEAKVDAARAANGGGGAPGG